MDVMEPVGPWIDVSFGLQLAQAPLDHGYVLYSAIAHAVPALHEAPWLGIHPLSGRQVDPRTLDLGKRPRLVLRLPSDYVRHVLPLAGRTLTVGNGRATVGIPTIHALRPAPSLDARMVAIKLTDVPRRARVALGRETVDVEAFQQRYCAELERQLASLDIRKPFKICGKRVLTVAQQRILGFAVRVTELTATESLRLLERGVGGRRRMGCGIFRPTRAK